MNPRRLWILLAIGLALFPCCQDRDTETAPAFFLNPRNYLTVTPADDLYEVVAAAPDNTVITLTEGTFNLTGHESNDVGVMIQGKDGLTITGQGWRRTKVKLPADLDLGFYIGGDVHGLTIEKMHIEGTRPLLTNTHAIGNYTSSTNVTNIRFRDLRVSDVAVGINIGTSPDGVYDQVEISGNIVTDALGTDSGWGYGIVCGNSTNVAISRNFVMNANRHGLYFGRSNPGSNILIANNFIYEHDRFQVQPLRVASALVAARSSDVRLAHNIVLNPHTYGLSVEAAEDFAWPTVDIVLLGNQVLGAYDAGIWIDTGETHAALGNSVVLRPGNPYWEFEYTRGSALASPDRRWDDDDSFFDFITELNGLVFVLKNGVLDKITPYTWEYVSSPDDWSGAVNLTAVNNADGWGNGRLYIGKGETLFEVDPRTMNFRAAFTDGPHLARIGTIPETPAWVADGVTEYRLDVFADTTHLPGQAFFLAEWDLVVPDVLTLTRALLPDPAEAGWGDFFSSLEMDDQANRIDSTIDQGESDDNVRLVRDVFSGAANKVGLLGSYFFTVNVGAPPGPVGFGLNQVVLSAVDFKVYTEQNGLAASIAPVTIVSGP
ncbi:MAG: right-handed parallel beta-helix repeat-containing protein [Pseudomonadota bacterium]